MIDKRFPFSSFPIGWYWIEFSENLPRARLRTKQWMGQQIVFWRDDQGKVCVANATCPHLGANLSPKFGGCLNDGLLVCPFHGFRYNTTGKCVDSPMGPPRTEVKLNTYPSHESGGVICAYWNPEKAEPEWLPPDLDDGDWSNFLYDSAQIRTHPQETSENGVDLTHLPYVHGYENVTALEPLQIDGHLLQNKFSMSRNVGPFSPLSMRLEIEATVTMWGLGYSMIEPRLSDAGIHVRQLALCTPIDGEHVDFVMAIQMKDVGNPNALIPGLGAVPKRLLNKWILKLFFSIYQNDISQDFDLWENKQYLFRPRLIETERSIIQYRRYCEQFYPANNIS